MGDKFFVMYLADEVFQTDTDELTTLLSKAIFHHSVSFKMFNDGKSDLYKNIKLFVHDGLDRPLDEKGTGIQSALIIALFSQYCNQFHNTSSLLIAEEPEVFLHPQARRVVSNELDKFLVKSSDQDRQLIISTHSVEFLKNVDPKNIVRVNKVQPTNETVVYQLCPSIADSLDNDFKKFLGSDQSEIFFADKAILVEGGEKYLLPSIVDAVSQEKKVLAYKNYSVVRTNGKGNFLNFIQMLEGFNIEWFVLGDLDCFKEDVGKLMRHVGIDDEAFRKNVEKITEAVRGNNPSYKKMKNSCLKNASRSLDAQTLMRVFEKFSNGEIERDDEDLLNTLEYIKERYSGKKALALIRELELEEVLLEVLEKLRQHNIFIWSKGELENYYTESAKGIKGSKDVVALKLAFSLDEDSDQLPNYFKHLEEVKDLVDAIVEH